MSSLPTVSGVGFADLPPSKRLHLTDQGQCRQGLLEAEFERRAALRHSRGVVVVGNSAFVGHR